MLKNPVSSSRSPGRKRASTVALVSWSMSTTPPASANQRQALGMAAAFARAAQIDLAAPAERLVVDVGPVMPAALALAMRARPDFHARLSCAMHARRRGEHHELEIVAQAREELVVSAVGMKVDFRLQRRADLARRAQRLDLLAYRVSQLGQPGPLRHEGDGVRRLRQLVPGLEEHAVIALAGEGLPELLGGERQDRRHQAHEAVRDVIKRALRRAAGGRVGLAGIEAGPAGVGEET